MYILAFIDITFLNGLPFSRPCQCRLGPSTQHANTFKLLVLFKELGASIAYPFEIVVEMKYINRFNFSSEF